MSSPKLRMVAGPNGSGKSTLLDYLRTAFSFPLGYCLNPDEIDANLARSSEMEFNSWGLQVEEASLRSFLREHPLGGNIGDEIVSVRNNTLLVRLRSRQGYFAAVLCDFMRRQWLVGGQSFTFETVMSSRDKVDLLKEAQQRDYRTYLYYICTDSATINRERVGSRVLQGGHAVPAEKIESRYERSLSLLWDAIRNNSRAYLFDNSGKAHRLIAEFEAARLVRISEDLPGWFVVSVLKRLDTPAEPG